MNIYLGNSFNTIDKKGENVLFTDDLLEFIYSRRDEIPFDTAILCDIDPYDDSVISNKELKNMIDICRYLLDSPLLDDYENSTYARKALDELIHLGEKAISIETDIISIGD